MRTHDGEGPEGDSAAATVPPVTDPAVLAEVAARRDEPAWRGWDVLPIVALTFVAIVPLHLLTGGLEEDAAPLPLADSGALLLVALGWLWLVRGRASLRRVFGPATGARPVLWRSLLLALGVGVALPVLDAGVHFLLEALAVELPPMQEQIQEWIDESPVLPLLVLDVVVLTPIAEEVLFRGVLFQGLARRWGVWAAAVVSSTLFGLAHVESAGMDSVFLAVSTGLFGLAATWLLHWRRTLIAPIAAHMVVNAAGTVAFLAS